MVVRMAEKRKNIIVRRTAQVLKSFTQEPNGWGITALASHLGLAKSVVFEILNTLVDEGLVKKDEKEKTYLCGNELLKLVLSHFSSIDIIKTSRPVLKKYVEKFGETLLLLQIIENKNIIVEKVEGTKPMRFILDIGMEVPLYKGSSGKVWLAFLPDEKREELINKYKIDFTTLEEEIEMVRKKGYSTSIEEIYPGVSAIAAPIFNNYSELIGVISAGGPSFRYKESSIPKILDTAKEISLQMGFQNWKW